MSEEIKILDRWGKPIETRSDLRNPDAWLWEYFAGGAPSAAGEAVNSKLAMTVSAFFACVNNISMDMAMLPKSVRRKLANGKGNEEIPDHPVALLFNQPNDYTDRHSFWQTFFAHALMSEGAYAEIEFDDAGRPIALHLIDPASVTCRWVENQEIYYVKLLGGGYVTLFDYQVLCLHGLGYDSVTGYNIAHLAKQVIGLSIALQKFQGAFFSNGATPSGILKHPAILDAEAVDRLRRQFEERYSGSLHSHKPMLLEEGLDFLPLTVDNDKAQMIELSKVPPLDICRMFRVPPSKIGITDAASFSTLEQQEQQYDSDCIATWDHKFRSACDFRLLSSTDRRTGIKTYENINALHRADIKTKDEHYKNMIYLSAMSINEVRALEDMNPIDGGDIRVFQLNLAPFDMMREIAEANIAKTSTAPPDSGDQQPGGDQPEPSQPAPDKPAQRDSIRDGFKQMIEINIQRMMRSEADKAKRSMSIDEYYESSEPYFRDYVIDVLGAVATAYESTCQVDKLALDYSRVHCKKSKTDVLAGDVTSWQDGTRASASAEWLISRIIGDTNGYPA